MGSEDIDSGTGSQSDEAASGSEDDGVGPSDRQHAAEGSADEEDEDEVGDLSWEAVMAAVQGGGSDDDGEDELEAVDAAAHNGHADAEPEAMPKQAIQGKPRKSFRASAAGKQGKAAGKQGKAVSKKSSKLGKRCRPT